jgi:anti-sigma B factor antagonist
MADLNIEHWGKDNSARFLLEGVIDTETSPKLQKVLLEEFAKVKHISLDLAKVSYISSAGLRVLLLGLKQTESGEKSIKLLHLTENVRDLFDTVGFTKLFAIE